MPRGRWSNSSTDLLPKLQELLLSSKNLERLTAELRKQVGRKRPGASGASALRKRIEGLDEELGAATRELKRAPDDLYDLAVGEVRRLRHDRETLSATLGATEARQGANREDAEARVQAALDRATRLHEVLGSEDPKAVRHALGEILERIDLYFEPVPGRKITRSALTRGVVRFREGSQLVVPTDLAP